MAAAASSLSQSAVFRGGGTAPVGPFFPAPVPIWSCWRRGRAQTGLPIVHCHSQQGGSTLTAREAQLLSPHQRATRAAPFLFLIKVKPTEGETNHFKVTVPWHAMHSRCSATTASLSKGVVLLSTIHGLQRPREAAEASERVEE